MAESTKPDVCDGLVSGSWMTKSGAEFLARAKCLIEEETNKLNPNTALLDFLCESVRLWRERERSMRVHFTHPDED